MTHQVSRRPAYVHALDRPILTDSGGFQVYSLSALRKIEEDGVHFKSHLDGRCISWGLMKPCWFSLPRFWYRNGNWRLCAVSFITWIRDDFDVQNDQMGRPVPGTEEGGQALFGIVSGESLWRSAEEEYRGAHRYRVRWYAVGGLSVGNQRNMHRMIRFTAPLLPEDKPRYLMG